MTDFMEEQMMELEALESIYPTEFALVSEYGGNSGTPASFYVTVDAEEDNEPDEELRDASEELPRIKINFTYTPTYPDTAPMINIEAISGLDDNFTTTLTQQLINAAMENLSMAMVFTLVSVAKEKLDSYTDAQRLTWRETKKAADRAALEAEERFQGTPCSAEVFLAWKTKFNLERATDGQKLGKVLVGGRMVDPSIATKPTGKQLFLNDGTLSASTTLAAEASCIEDVLVDESLFVDVLGGLDLTDDDDDDDDYLPGEDD